jgi:ferredoxin--NADP+ reductase
MKNSTHSGNPTRSPSVPPGPGAPPQKHLSAERVAALRSEHYNATAVAIQRIHDELLIMRVRPDDFQLQFTPGQYTVLGLGYWEPRLADTQEEQVDEDHRQRLAKRAYSVSCSLIDDDGQIVRATERIEQEFYITLVRYSAAHPPALTPRLFAMTTGDRLFISPHVHGHYSLDGVQSDDDVIFVSTGTGEAPHNAMLAELLSHNHRGRIVNVSCVRHNCDLGYLAKHRRLETLFANYQYLTLTTREPENLDPSVEGFIGKRHLQDYFRSGDFQADSGLSLDPATTKIFLCGNPLMIGVPHHTHDPLRRYPQPTGMVEVLERMGFAVDRPHEPGNIFFEKYW